MRRVVEFLQANPVQYLAAIERDGKAKCCPLIFCFKREGKLWLRINNTKEAYKDMQVNSEVEASVSSPEYARTRLHGKVVLKNNVKIEKGALENPVIKNQYETPENPIFKVFHLENARGLITGFSGNPSYTL